ncbi:MarR family winged helix-turn-helix transcriptional regulator [Amycolatopsis australiensis]|uniref:DNA-binding transcriptional regulator, MarR family n=1 Tax=Amycolatopsis australiensis TaxID=546364 RepID=A0A1K1S7N5_9PSEU|nr:MarR family transcriptional regulator [Amycolatopsis australiensis]SFW80334.1 DNA-binding transcriptional regulator, MarR family [Amycolatopsis australiensis]
MSPEDWQFWDTWMRAHRLLVAELDRALQRDCGISKAEFSVLMTLRQPMRVGALADALGWEKSRVSHLLTRMEHRGLVERTEDGASGRRTGVGPTADGRRTAERAIRAHGGNIRRLVLDRLTPEQAAAIRGWSEQVVRRLDG